jgi:ribonuclease VapC
LFEVTRFCTALGITTVPIGSAETAEAVIAHRRYGKGHHPARLNMGDCFAYACARTNNARLLYKGDDFSHTDLA